MISQSFNICGVSIRSQSTLPEIQKKLRNRLERYVGDSMTNAEIEIEIHASSKSDKVQAAKIPKTFHWIRSRPLWGHLDKDILQLTDGTSLSISRVDAGKVTYKIDPQSIGDENFFERTFLLLPLLEVLRRKGFLFLHGALLARNDLSILIFGEGGAGKSTLSAALYQQGFYVYGDDTLLLNTKSGEVLPLETELSVAENVGRVLMTSTTSTVRKTKHRFRLSDLQEEERKDGSCPQKIVRLRSGKTDQRFPISRSGILETILKDNPLLLSDTGLGHKNLKDIQLFLEKKTLVGVELNHDLPLDFVNLSSRFLMLVQD